jgi:hypothetical protein
MIKRTTISLNIESIGQLKQLAKEEHRPISSQIVHMMVFYQNNNNHNHNNHNGKKK